VKRQFPDIKYLNSLIVWRIPFVKRKARAVAAAASIPDLAKLAKKKVPLSVFDYVEGSALDEIGIARSHDAFRRVEFHPQILRDVSKIDTSTEILGASVSLPIIFAPTGYTKMMHHTGEPAVARVAAAHNLIYTLSTMGTTSPQELAEAVPDVRRWFQVYVMRNREDTINVVTQAADNGFEALILTVDTPVTGLRLRDVRNGLTVPPRITFSTLLNMTRKPRWWFNLITTPRLEFAAFRGWDKSLGELAELIFDPTIEEADVKWLQTIWKGPIIVKGVQTKEDAIRLAKLGVQGIVLSNHGARQLDRGPVPLEILEEVVAAVGKKLDVYIDGGVLSGQDVYAAIALGAKAVLMGRAYLYGIMAGGEAGVEKAIQIMKKEFINTMALTGVRTVDEIRASKARIRP
jgi:isopentenyl diphosphate isomerase/L-lactate dehydrogenase-like FMN-dependent dehydrogenase